MATRQVRFEQRELRLGDEFENGYKALAHRREIKESGRMLLATFGDQLEQKARIEGDISQSPLERRQGPHISPLRRIFNAVDTVLEKLEHSGKNAVESFKKQETVLRGVFHLVDLGNQAAFFAILDFVSSFLDTPDDPFRVKREFVLDCLKDVEKQKDTILRLVEEAGQLLKEIVDTENVEISRGIKFDNTIREAHLQITSCRRRLKTAEDTIYELSSKMITLKWFSRTVRLAGWGVSCYFFYQKYRESSYGLPLVCACSGIAAAVWLSLFPSHAYESYEDISKLASTHFLLTERLEDLRENLSSAKDYKDGLTQGAGDAV